MDSGFFYVINHGISQKFLDEVFAQSKRFFNLPLEEKMKLVRNEKNRGYSPILDEYLDPVHQIQGLSSCWQVWQLPHQNTSFCLFKHIFPCYVCSISFCSTSCSVEFGKQQELFIKIQYTYCWLTWNLHGYESLLLDSFLESQKSKSWNISR